MAQNHLRVSVLLLAPVLMGAMLFLSGCKGKDEPEATPPAATQPSQPSPPQKVTVEFRPPESGERLRRHIYGPDGVTEVELQIEYSDGRMGYRYFRPDGKLKESKETHPGGRVMKRHAYYDVDGSTVLAESTYRIDGTQESAFKLLPDGTREQVAYRLDGKRVLSVEVTRRDKSSEKTYFRKDGSTLWARFITSSAGVKEVEYFGEDGVLQHKRLTRSAGLETTVYRPDGTASHRQSWRSTGSYYYYRRLTIESVEEYAADGKTLVRKLVYSYDGRDLRESHLFNANGSKASIRYFRSDGTLEKEEFLDAGGKVTKTEQHTVEEGIRESVDDALRTEPTFDDPSDPYRRIDD